MKYAVTGGAGFIGSHLVKNLAEHGNEIIVIDNLNTGKKKNIEKFSEKIEAIPIINEYNRLKSIAWRRTSQIRIGSYLIGEESPIFVIAEIGNNHNGDIVLAKNMVDAAIESGADYVKFQSFKAENIVTKKVQLLKYQRSKIKNNSQYELLKKLELSEKNFKFHSNGNKKFKRSCY